MRSWTDGHTRAKNFEKSFFKNALPKTILGRARNTSGETFHGPYELECAFLRKSVERGARFPLNGGDGDGESTFMVFWCPRPAQMSTMAEFAAKRMATSTCWIAIAYVAENVRDLKP